MNTFRKQLSQSANLIATISKVNKAKLLAELSVFQYTIMLL